MAQMLELNTVKVSYRFSFVALNETMAHGRQGWYKGAIIKQVVKCSLQSTSISASTLQNMGRTVHFSLSWYQLRRGRNIHLASKDTYRPGQDLGGVTSRR